MDWQMWTSLFGFGAFLVVLLGYIQLLLHRMETRLTKQIEDVRSLMAGHTHPPSEDEARFRMP